jgi:hypothetical protein
VSLQLEESMTAGRVTKHAIGPGFLSLQLEESMTVGRVTKQAIRPGRTGAGTYNENLCLNIMIYKVKFPGGQLKEYIENVIDKDTLN